MPPAIVAPSSALASHGVAAAARPRLRWWWLALGLLGLVVFPSYMYLDIVSTSSHGVNVWRSLADGKLAHFYSYNDYVGTDSEQFPLVRAQYGFLCYLIFAIWNLPLFVAQHWFGVSVFDSVPFLLWAKSIDLAFVAIVVAGMVRLGRALGLAGRERGWAVVLFLTGGITLHSILVLGQYDIVHMAFTVFAVEAWLRGRTRWFIVLGGAALAIKFFPLLILVPLLLLVEKRLLHIASKVIAILIPMIAFNIPFLGDTERTTAPSTLIEPMILAGFADIGLGVAPFIAAYAALCIGCWIAPQAGLAQRQRHGMYVAAAPMLLLMMLTPAFPYWGVIPLPFVALAMVQQAHQLRLLLLLDALWIAASGLYRVRTDYWGWNGRSLAPMPVAGGSVPDALALLPTLDRFSSYLSTLAFVGCTGLLWFLSPFARRTALQDPATAFHDEQGVMALRFAVGVVLCLLPLAGLVWVRATGGA